MRIASFLILLITGLGMGLPGLYLALLGGSLLTDVGTEIQRLEKLQTEKKKHMQGIQAKLDNPNFVGKAPPEVVQQQRDQVTELQNQLRVIEENLKDLRQDEPQ